MGTARDEIARRNRSRWKEYVEEDFQYTRPWLTLERSEIESFAWGEIEVMPEPYRYLYPQCVFRNAAGKDVLCLASGGGQQSAAFGLLGARVTVVDFCAAQLRSDREAARHHGYRVRAIEGDMRDLSRLRDESFDLVFQAISICFVPEVREVYREVARVLRNGGLYRVGHINPATFLVGEGAWDGNGYAIDAPFFGGLIPDEYGDETFEYRHLFSDMFNGLVETGFRIRGVWEDPRHRLHDPAAQPGTAEHLLGFVQQYFCILAQKEATSPDPL